MCYPCRLRPLLSTVVVVAAFLVVAVTDAHAIPPTGINQILVLGASEIGLSPEAIIVSGLHSSSAAIFQNLTSAQSLCATLADQRNELSIAVANASQAEEVLHAEPDDPTLQEQYQAAVAVAQAATAAVANTHEALLSHVMTDTSELGQQQYEIFQQSAGRRVPASFRAKARTDSEWCAIELALIAEARAQFLGEPLGDEQEQLLAGIRGEIEVIAAQAALDANLAGVQAAFGATLLGQNTI